MKKFLSAILTIWYFFTFILAVQSLGEPRNFAIIWVLPAFFMMLSHSIILFKKSVSRIYRKIIIVFDFLFGVSPLIFMDISVFSTMGSIIWAIPLVCSILSFILIVLENKRNN